MSNIEVPEERILQLEDYRILGRNNLRKQGVDVTDNIDIGKVMQKIEDVPSPKKLIHKEIEEYIDDELTVLDVEYFSNNQNLENLEIDNLEKSTVAIRYCGCKKLYLPKFIKQEAMYQFSYNNKMTKLCTSGLMFTGSGSFSVYNDNLIYFDAGHITQISGGAPIQMYTFVCNCNNLRYFILRSEVLVTMANTNPLSNTPFSSPSGNAKLFISQSLVGQYSIATNWSTKYFTEISLEGSRFESPYWMKKNNSLCTLDGHIIEVNDDETAAVFKHTENIEHVYENGVELQDTDLIKDRTLTSTV